MSAFFTTGVVAMTATSAGDRFTGTVSFTRTDLQTGFFLTVVHRFTKANPFGARAAEAPAGAHAVKTENVIIRAPVTLFVLAVLQPSARSRFMEPFFHQCHHQTFYSVIAKVFSAYATERVIGVGCGLGSRRLGECGHRWEQPANLHNRHLNTPAESRRAWL
jgi:hypothetical protein